MSGFNRGGGGLPLGLPGATAPTRYVGGTSSGAPVTGTFAVGDYVVDATGVFYVCTVAGSPGTWVASISTPGGNAGGDLAGTYPNPTIGSNKVTLAKLATQAAATYLANTTASAAVPTAVPLPFILDPSVTNRLPAVTFDPTIARTTFTPTGATIYLGLLPVPYSRTITNILVPMAVGGTTYTNAQLGCWTSAGVFLSATAVQAAAGANGFGAGAAGTVTLPLSAAQAIVGGPTVYVWLGLHMGTNGATSATFRCGDANGNAVNFGCTTSTLRYATYTGSATNDLATIGNLTPTSMTLAGSPMPFGIS